MLCRWAGARPSTASARGAELGYPSVPGPSPGHPAPTLASPRASVCLCLKQVRTWVPAWPRASCENSRGPQTFTPTLASVDVVNATRPLGRCEDKQGRQVRWGREPGTGQMGFGQAEHTGQPCGHRPRGRAGPGLSSSGSSTSVQTHGPGHVTKGAGRRHQAPGWLGPRACTTLTPAVATQRGGRGYRMDARRLPLSRGTQRSVASRPGCLLLLHNARRF